MLRYAILCHGRAGGHLLCDMLAQTGKAGFNANRHVKLLLGFGEGLKDIDYVQRTIEQMEEYNTTDNGVQALKINSPALIALTRFQPCPKVFDILHLFDKYILLTRYAVEQAISWHIAQQEGQWRGSQKPNGKKAKYDFRAIADRIALIDSSDAFFFSWLTTNRKDFIRIDYSALSKDCNNTVNSVLEFLEIDATVDGIQPRMKKQDDKRKITWKKKFEAEFYAR